MTHFWTTFLTSWFGLLVPCFFGIGMGPSQEQKTAQGLLAGEAAFGVNKGEANVNKSSDFWSAIMSGDHDAIMRVLGPQITNIKAQGQQQKETAAQFGNRSGGTNASLQTVDDRTRSQIDNLISSLTGEAATNLQNSGLNLLNVGTGAGMGSFEAASTIQRTNAAKWNDIFNSIAKIAAGAAGMPTVPQTGVIGSLG